MANFVCWVLLTSIVSNSCAADKPNRNKVKSLESIANIKEKKIQELSGFVRSRRQPGVYWAVSDSLNPSNLYAVNLQGQVLATFIVNAINIDWEALAIDGDGHIYICDVGNNIGIKTRSILKIKEPQVGSTPNRVHVMATYHFTFPEQPFDIEAAFFVRTKLYLVSKSKKGTNLYSLAVDARAKQSQLKFVCEIKGIPTVTGAGVSNRQEWLALTSYDEVCVFRLPSGNIEKLSDPVLRTEFKAPSIESVAWSANQKRLILLSENNTIYSIPVESLPASTKADRD